MVFYIKICLGFKEGGYKGILFIIVVWEFADNSGIWGDWGRVF